MNATIPISKVVFFITIKVATETIQLVHQGVTGEDVHTVLTVTHLQGRTQRITV